MCSLIFADFKMWWCLKFHKLTVIKHFDRFNRCIKCHKGHYYGMNDNVHAFIRWDSELTDLFNFNPQIEVNNAKE